MKNKLRGGKKTRILDGNDCGTYNYHRVLRSLYYKCAWNIDGKREDTKFHTQRGGKPGNGKHSLVRSCCRREVNFTAHPGSWDRNVLNPLRLDLKNINNISLSSYLTDSTMYLLYKDQPVKAVEGNYLGLLLRSYVRHKYTT